MAGLKARNAYEQLLQALQQQNQQQLNPDFGSVSIPGPGSPGGLLGGLLTTLAMPNQQQAAPANIQLISSGAKGPGFRQLARLVQPQTVAAPSIVPDDPDNFGAPADGSTTGTSGGQFAAGDSYRKRMSDCVDQCLHLLSSPSGDLQSSEFRQCVGRCMGRL